VGVASVVEELLVEELLVEELLVEELLVEELLVEPTHPHILLTTNGSPSCLHSFSVSRFGQRSYLTWSAVDKETDIFAPPTKGGPAAQRIARKYPLFQRAHPVPLELRGGECLYLPSGWAHKVLTHQPSLMVSLWRLKRPAVMGGANDGTLSPFPGVFYGPTDNLLG
jgi:hypothetical protein